MRTRNRDLTAHSTQKTEKWCDDLEVSTSNRAYVLEVTDKQADDSPASSLEVLESVPESLVRRVKQYSGRLSTEAVHVMGERLPFFADLEASQRASVQLVVQTALVNFAEWMRNPRGDVGYTAEAFALVPQELTRRIALRQTVDMVRVTMEHFE